MSNSTSDQALRGQAALVTGAGRRIGREIALTLARSGADVIVNYSQSRAEAEATVLKIRALGVRSFAVRADVSRPLHVQRMFGVVDRKWGRLDILINNAGIFFPVRWDRLTEDDWERVLGTNLKGAFFCAQEAAKLMQRQKRGCIVNISSLGGLKAWPDYIHYCSSKAGMIMMTRCLARALAPKIRVNSIAPGTVLFPGEKRGRLIRRVIRATPLQKAGRPEDIAAMVLYLVSRGRFITGQVFAVDGGQSVA